MQKPTKTAGKICDGKAFSRILLNWNRHHNKRQMPWKAEKDPYRVWLSEIILQQTRVEQGLAYYQRFTETFPSIHDLAHASESKVFKLWEGLGYYTRCRNLVTTARHISRERKGIFPATYNEIKALKGIGPYTAAAISSFAFNLPHAVVDGNVFRVLSRVFGIAIPIDSTEGRKEFTRFANEILDKKDPGIYNQAIMDFGAVICKPSTPQCHDCVFSKCCYAFLHEKVYDLPVKEKKTAIKKRWFYYLVMQQGNKIAIRQRTTKDIWNQLYEFPMVETATEKSEHVAIAAAEKQGLLQKNSYEVVEVSPVFRQQLSHQLIIARFLQVRVKPGVSSNGKWSWATRKQFEKLAFPRLINHFITKQANATGVP